MRIELEDSSPLEGALVGFDGTFISVKPLDLALRVDWEDVVSISI